MSIILYGLFGVAILAVVIYFLNQHNKKTNERFQAFADQHGLSYSPASWSSQPALRGTFRGVEVQVYSETRRHGKNSTTYLIHKAHMSSSATPVGLVMFREGLLSKVGKFLGKEDIQTGLEDIDKEFIIRGADKQEVLEFLRRPGVRGALLELIRTDRSMHLENDVIHIEMIGAMSRIEQVRERLEMIVRCAGVLEETRRQLVAPPASAPNSWQASSSWHAPGDDENKSRQW